MKIILISLTIGIGAVFTNLAPAADLTYTVYTNTASFIEAVGHHSIYNLETIPVGTNCKNYDFGDFSIEGAALYKEAFNVP